MRDNQSSESGLDYALNRFYSSTYGRFQSPDLLAGSMGSPQSWNRYAYTGNDPGNFIDPSGLQQEKLAQVNAPDPRFQEFEFLQIDFDAINAQFNGQWSWTQTFNYNSTTTVALSEGQPPYQTINESGTFTLTFTMADFSSSDDWFSTLFGSSSNQQYILNASPIYPGMMGQLNALKAATHQLKPSPPPTLQQPIPGQEEPPPVLGNEQAADLFEKMSHALGIMLDGFDHSVVDFFFVPSNPCLMFPDRPGCGLTPANPQLM